MRESLRTEIIHAARCDICNADIKGIRYKVCLVQKLSHLSWTELLSQCMHPQCPDFDLCQNCEALPFPVHPPAHPMLKMRTPDTIVPIVLHPGHGSLNQQSFEDGVTWAPTPPCVQEATEDHDEISPRHAEDNWQSLLSQLRADTEVEQTGFAMEESEVLRRYPVIPLTQSEVSDVAATPSAPLMQSIDMSATSSPVVFIPPPIFYTTSPAYGPVIVDQIDEPLVNLPTPMQPATPTQLASPVAKPVAEPHLIDLEKEESIPPKATSDAAAISDVNSNGVSTPSEVPASVTSANSVPRLDPVSNNEWRELWPELTAMLKHLLQPPTPGATIPTVHKESMPGAMFEEKQDEIEQPLLQVAGEPRAAVEESPLVGEPLLQRPLVPERAPTIHRDIRDYFNVPPPPPLRKDTKPAAVPRAPSPKPVLPPKPAPPRPMVALPCQMPVVHQPLFATFVSDNNIPDGQVFPPGAEFVKSWKMVNKGTRDWPETTELVFVAGDRMAPHANASRSVKIGAVKAGAEVEIVAGEMKVRTLRCM